jgi:hypothetical protein
VEAEDKKAKIARDEILARSNLSSLFLVGMMRSLRGQYAKKGNVCMHWYNFITTRACLLRPLRFTQLPYPAPVLAAKPGCSLRRCHQCWQGSI